MRRGKKNRTDRSKQEMRREHVRHQRGRCCYCLVKMLGGKAEHPQKATLEHIIPSCFFGRNNRKNTAAACTSCNSKRNESLPSLKMIINLIRTSRLKSLDIVLELAHWYLSINLIKLMCEVNYATSRNKNA